MTKRSAKRKNGPSKDATPTSSSNILKFRLPARHTDIETTLKPPAVIVQAGPELEPPTLALPQSLQAAVIAPVDTLPHSCDAQNEQDTVEIRSTPHPEIPVTPPAATLLNSFLMLEDSQDESETSLPTAQKPKQRKTPSQSAQAKAELDEKARRKSNIRKWCRLTWF